MSVLKSYRLLGLNLRDNRTSAAEEVSCATAKNVYARDPGELATRPEIETFGAANPGAGSAVRHFATLGGNALGCRADGDLIRLADGTSCIPPVGTGPGSTVSPPRAAALGAHSSVVAADSLLLRGDAGGVVVLDGAAGGADAVTLRPGGLPRPGLPRALVGGAGNAWLAAGGRVAYRAVLGLNTANGRILLSSPSDRVEAHNTSGSPQCTTLIMYLPPGLRPELTYFIQLYRSEASTTGPASDEMGQVWEATIAPGEILLGQATLVDVVEDGLRGTPLYSNERQEGGLEVNDSPPSASHLAAFADCAFYLGASRPATAAHEILAGLAVGEEVGIGLDGPGGARTATFTAVAAGFVVDPLTQFAVETSGSVTQNAQATAQNLVRAINQNGYANQDLFASFSSAGGLGGTIALYPVARANAVSTSTSAPATANKFSPQWGSPDAQDGTRRPGRLYFSKPGLPEAVPPINYLDTHDSGTTLGGAAVGNSLFVLRSDGIWRVTGAGPESFQVEPFETSYSLAGSGCFTVLGESLFCLSSAGVLMGGESGFRLISGQVEPLLVGPTDTWMAADQVRQLLLFGFKATGVDRRILVYALRTGQWTTWELAMQLGAGRPDGASLLLSTEDGNVHQLRSKDLAPLGSDTLRTNAGGTVVSTIAISVEPLPMDLGDALLQKHFQEVGFALEETPGTSPNAVNIAFSRDGVAEFSQFVPIQGYATGVARTPVPRNFRRAGVLRVRLDTHGIRSVRGLRLRFAGTSEKTNR